MMVRITSCGETVALPIGVDDETTVIGVATIH